MTWVLKFIGSSILLLMFFAMIEGGHEQPVVTTTEESNLASIARYTGDKNPSIVLVGSSLAYRLSEEYFSALKVDNLALAGGSSNTGLEIIVKEPTLPSLVIIETNMIARPTDKAIIGKYYESRPYFARPIRLLAQRYESLLHPKASKERVTKELNELLSSPPMERGDQQQVARSVATSFPAYPRDSIEMNLIEMRNLIAALERRGIKYTLLEMPMPPELDSAPFIAEAKKRVRTMFPDQGTWLKLSIDSSELRWPDGAHLDKRSAILVARAIEASAKRALSEVRH